LKKKEMNQAILQIKVSVGNVTPEIWRRIFVRSDATFAQLHLTLQSMMSWSNHYHYSFKAGGERYAPPQEVGYEFGSRKSVKTKLFSIFGKNTTTMMYEYGFSKGWVVDLHLEGTLVNTGQATTVLCTEGARHGPAEDSGGPREYMEKVKILKSPGHNRYQEMKEAIGPRFDAEDFNLAKTNEKLRKIG
jgi:hypothetical protein